MTISEGAQGLIFNVTRGSFVDGYGIRTTVFLKGCPLRCIWCCNPEGQRGTREIKVNPSLCNGCGRCTRACPVGAISVDDSAANGVKIQLNRAICTECFRCVEVCYTGALDFFGRYVTVGELFDVVKRDEPFYRASGGGVTLGGGEPTLQYEFTRAFLEKCKRSGIHVALDTCGYTLAPEGLTLLEDADLLLFDLKGMDSNQHLKATGVSNEKIIRNLRRLNELQKPIIIRVPIVPGYTDSPGNVKATAEFVSTLRSVERVDLLPYHEYGVIKYHQLGREYKATIRSPTREEVEAVRDVFRRHGVNVQIGG
ncbi:MAG: glycyl-radical enzyme activating protein [Moorellaceae bacterium]